VQRKVPLRVQFAFAKIRAVAFKFGHSIGFLHCSDLSGRSCDSGTARNGSCSAPASVHNNRETKETRMKKYLIMACAIAALVGCARERGGVDNRSGSQTGRSESYDRNMQSTNSNTITNDSSGAPGTSTGANTGSNTSGTGQKN
jgi:hypothetical protein